MVKSPTLLERVSRLNGITKIIARANNRLVGSPKVRKTGFVPLVPYSMPASAALLARKYLREGSIALDLGCGIGNWTIPAAAVGFRSYGLDVNPELIAQAEFLRDQAQALRYLGENSCTFALGNIHHGMGEEDYKETVRKSGEVEKMPLVFTQNPYEQIGIKLSEADIIYSYLWPQHMPSLCRMLAQNAKREALFVLPLYQVMSHLNFPLRILDRTSEGLAILTRR